MTATSQHQVLFTGRTHTTGGRNGESRSDDGHLAIALTTPGAQGAGTNPEQLFAAGWSACFLGAMSRAAKALQASVPATAAVDAEVDLCTNDDGFFLAARLKVRLPGVPRELAQAIVEGAHQICPYSKATRGNIGVELSIA